VTPKPKGRHDSAVVNGGILDYGFDDDEEFLDRLVSRIKDGEMLESHPEEFERDSA
jgi:hypothetical protein